MPGDRAQAAARASGAPADAASADGDACTLLWTDCSRNTPRMLVHAFNACLQAASRNRPRMHTLAVSSCEARGCCRIELAVWGSTRAEIATSSRGPENGVLQKN